MSGIDAGRNLFGRGVSAGLGHVAVEVVRDVRVAADDLEDGVQVEGVVLPH